MKPITGASSGGSIGTGGAGIDADDTARKVDGGGAARRDNELGQVYDLLDRHSQRPIGQVAGAGTEGAEKKKDPTELPSPAERARSFAAIGAAGFTDVHLKPVPYFNQGNGEWAHHPYP